MKKEPTREQILERMVKNIIDEYVDEDSIVGSPFDYFYESARKELIRDGYLTEKQKSVLRQQLIFLTNCTGRRYTKMEYRLEPVKHMRLYYKTVKFSDTKTWVDEETHDSISGTFVSFSDDVFEVNRRYSIEELLR